MAYRGLLLCSEVTPQVGQKGISPALTAQRRRRSILNVVVLITR
jgi:hypothetical protein